MSHESRCKCPLRAGEPLVRLPANFWRSESTSSRIDTRQHESSSSMQRAARFHLATYHPGFPPCSPRFQASTTTQSRSTMAGGNGMQLFWVQLAMLIPCLVFTGLRVYVRAAMARSFSADDWIIVLAMVTIPLFLPGSGPRQRLSPVAASIHCIELHQHAWSYRGCHGP